jgi:hypothetical protein
VEVVDLTGVSVFIDEEATRRELGYLNVRCGVTEMDREDEGRKELTEESVRRVVGDVIGTEMVAVIAIGGVAVSNTGGGGYGYSIRFSVLFSCFDFAPPPQRRKISVCNTCGG